MIDINSIKASLNALLITFSLLKLELKGSSISMSFILKILPMAVVEDNKEKIKSTKKFW